MTAGRHTEHTLEDLIEAHLIEQGGWRKGNPADFDAELALTTPDLFAFIQATQPDTWDRLRKQHQKLKLFQFKRRALVHFAVDPERVAMATHVQGQDTVFLPFNRGCDGGAGNPPHPSGIRTAYLWEEVLQRDSFLLLNARF